MLYFCRCIAAGDDDREFLCFWVATDQLGTMTSDSVWVWVASGHTMDGQVASSGVAGGRGHGKTLCFGGELSEMTMVMRVEQ